MEQDEAAVLADSIEQAVNNPEETAQRIEEKLGSPMGILDIIQDFIKSYDAKESAVSDEDWLAMQFARSEYADAFKGADAQEECRAAAKGIVQGVDDYENAKKSLCFHIDQQNGSPESWLAGQIDIGAKNNNTDPAEYAAQLSEGLDEAIEETACFIFNNKEDNKAPVPGSSGRIGRPWAIVNNKLQLLSDLNIALPPVQLRPAAALFEDEAVRTEQNAARHERVAARIKRWTYPIAGGLEIARRLGLLPPPLNLINYTTLGAKVRNGIDNIVTVINVASGNISVEAGYEEYRRNISAHAGDIAAAAYTRLKGTLNLPEHPVKAAAKMAFGKAGSAIVYTAQQALTAVVPPLIRTAIKTGGEALGRAAANGIRTAGNALASAGRSLIGRITGRQ